MKGLVTNELCGSSTNSNIIIYQWQAFSIPDFVITRSIHRSHLNEAQTPRLHCAPNHESLEFFRGFHLSELGMNVLKVTHIIPILHWTFSRFWSMVTRCVHPLFK